MAAITSNYNKIMDYRLRKTYFQKFLTIVNDEPLNTRRDSIIAADLDTPEGRVALAQSMVEPISRALEYQAIGRNLLMVDELLRGALARYERDFAAVANVIGGQIPRIAIEGDEVFAPTFEISANPQIRLADIANRRFSIVDRGIKTVVERMTERILGILSTTKEDVEEVQRQLAMTANDPNLILTTGHVFSMGDF